MENITFTYTSIYVCVRCMRRRGKNVARNMMITDEDTGVIKVSVHVCAYVCICVVSVCKAGASNGFNPKPSASGVRIRTSSIGGGGSGGSGDERCWEY